MCVNGSPHASITLPYNFTLNVTGSAGSGTETYSVTVLPAENYTGKLSNIIISNTTGAEIYNTSVDVSTVAGTELRIDYKYPFAALSGDNLQLQLVKEDGGYLQVRAGTTSTSIPWRALSMAAISSDELAAATGYASNRVLITDSTGRISVSALQNNRAVVSNASGAPIAATTTATEVDNIRGGVTRNTSLVIEDSDGFVFNDGGTMMQASAGRVWAYIQGKMAGAISTAITGNLTANRMVYTDANGKLTVATPAANRLMASDANSGVVAAAAITASRALASNANGIPEASSTTTAELNNIRGGVTRDGAVTLTDDDGVVVNDGGTMIQAAMSRVWAYIQSKITGAVSGVLTSNLTANQALISGSDGKITTRNLGANRIVLTDANGLPTAAATLAANRIMMTDSSGLPTTASATGPIYYTGSTNAAGTTTVISGFKGGFTVSFVRTASTIYLQVTHTQLGSRYQYQTTINGGSPSSFWTSSSGQNYPANLPSLASNGGSMSGWFFGTDGNSQLETIRVDFSIITNGAATAVMWWRVC